MQSDSSLAQSSELQRRLPAASFCMKELSLQSVPMRLSLGLNVNAVTRGLFNNRLRPTIDRGRDASSGFQYEESD